MPLSLIRDKVSDSRLLKRMLIVSCLIHAVALTRISYLNLTQVRHYAKNVEISYYNIKLETNENRGPASKPKEKSEESDRGIQAFLQKKTDLKAFVKDMSKLSEAIEFNEKQPVNVNEPEVKKKVSVPILKSEKISNPIYLNYYQIVRTRIKERAYANYSKSDAGEVYLTFVLLSDGSLKQIQLVEDRSSKNPYLRDISLKSIKEAAPFPSFPADLNYPELSFNVAISFE